MTKIGFTRGHPTNGFTVTRLTGGGIGRHCGRRLIAVDIENIAEGAVTDARRAARAHHLLAGAVAPGSGDLVVIGTSHVGLLPTYLGWPGAPRIVVQSGPDGADLALLDVLDGERVEDRFAEVVLVSGDGIFADSIARLGAAGVSVTVVARSCCLAKRLKLAAGRTVLLAEAADHVGGVA